MKKKRKIRYIILFIFLFLVISVLSSQNLYYTFHSVKLNIYLNNNIELKYKNDGDKIRVIYDSRNKKLRIKPKYGYNMYDIKLYVEKYINEKYINIDDINVRIVCTWEGLQKYTTNYTYLEYKDKSFNTLISNDFTLNSLGNFDFSTIEYFSPGTITSDIDFSRFTNLKTLSLSSNYISETYLSTLKKVLPKDCQIVGYVIDNKNGIK